MPCEILVRATNHPNGKWMKGFPVVVKDTPAVWGGAEGPPHYVIVRITNATKPQVEGFLAQWRNTLAHTIVGDTALAYTVEVRFSARIAQLFPDKSMRQSLRDYLANEWGVLITSHDTNSATFTIPKPVSLADLKADILDKFEEQVDVTRYMFSSADVDTALAAGGVIELTRAQAANRIIDRAS